MGLTIGRPAEQPRHQPCQPIEALVSFERYGGTSNKVKALLGDKEIMDKYLKIFKLTLTPNGNYDNVSKSLWECLKQYFNIV